MKEALLKVLKIENLEKLSLEAKGECVRQLKEEGVSYRQIADKIGVPHNTIFYWLKGKEEINGTITASLDRISEHLKKYTPKKGDKLKLQNIIIICQDKLSKL